MELLLALTIFVAAFVVYFLPWLIADRRGCQASAGIKIVNFLFGVTVVGWGLALVWAVTGKTRDQQAQEASDLASAIKMGSKSTADEIEKLAALRDRGAITEQEFAAQKAKLLSS